MVYRISDLSTAGAITLFCIICIVKLYKREANIHYLSYLILFTCFELALFWLLRISWHNPIIWLYIIVCSTFLLWRGSEKTNHHFILFCLINLVVAPLALFIDHLQNSFPIQHMFIIASVPVINIGYLISTVIVDLTTKISETSSSENSQSGISTPLSSWPPPPRNDGFYDDL